MTTVILSLMGAFFGFVVYLVLTSLNVNLSLFTYKQSFKKGLAQNLKFFVLFAVFFGGGASLVSVAITGIKLSLLNIAIYYFIGLFFNLLVFFVISLWIYLMNKVFKNDSYVFIATIIFLVIILVVSLL